MRTVSSKLTAAPRKRRERQERTLSLAIHSNKAIRYRRHLRTKLLEAHAILRPPLRSLSLALVGDRTMSELHEQYLGIPGPTDVLTFELEHDHHGRVTQGEVVVCVPEARRRAGECGTRVRDEVLLYALHGVLHLCGFDDRTASGFRRMHRAEDEILTRLGVGPVFAPEPRAIRLPSRKSARAPARAGGR